MVSPTDDQSQLQLDDANDADAELVDHDALSDLADRLEAQHTELTERLNTDPGRDLDQTT